MNKSIISINGVHKKFGRSQVLKNINLEINQGEILGLIGPNGAGKTTLIQILLNIITPDSGNILFFGKKIEKINKEKFYQKVNFFSPGTSFHDQLTVKQNLLTFAQLYEIDNHKQKLDKLLEFFNLEQLYNQNKKVAFLSSGEKRRLGLCKALINDPEILFLDEPTVNLDHYIKTKLLELILQIHKRKKNTIIIVSHQPYVIGKLATRIAILNNKKIQAVIRNKKGTDLSKLYKQCQPKEY
jgi:ABC-2 type transport system ATP-binding protein